MGQHREGSSLYAEVTARIVAELEAGRLPWIQPWDSVGCVCTLPCNASTGQRYSGINILLLWGAVIERGYAGQRWLTYLQAQALVDLPCHPLATPQPLTPADAIRMAEAYSNEWSESGADFLQSASDAIERGIAPPRSHARSRVKNLVDTGCLASCTASKYERFTT